MLSFEHPALLALGGIALITFSLLLLRRQRRSAILVPLGPPGGASFDSPLRTDMVIRFLRCLEFLGALSLILAASGPIRVTSERVWLERGADILFVIDASPSMSARDMGEESRFEAAIRLVKEFSASRPADAIGLVALGESAALLVPPTVDREALFTRLETLEIGELGDGTALGLGLSIASLHLSTSRSPRRAAILITDGENNSGEIHPATAAGSLRSVGASLWVLGVGSTGETMIDYVDPVTRKRRSGLFSSRFDPEVLRSIARSGGGTFLPASSAEAFAESFSRLSRTEATATLSRERTNRVPLERPFIALGLTLILAVRFVRRHILGALL